MSLLGGAECSTAGNPLTQFKRRDEHDNSLQRDRQVGRAPNSLEEGFRSRIVPNGPDKMDEFLHAAPSPIPFVMEQMRQDLPGLSNPIHQGSTNWMAEFEASQKPRSPVTNLDIAHHHLSAMEAAVSLAGTQSPESQNSLHKPNSSASAYGMSPMAAHRSPMGMGYSNGMGFGSPIGMGLGMGLSGYSQVYPEQQAAPIPESKGKSRVIELDDSQWEAQFAAVEQSQREQDAAEDSQAMDTELGKANRSVNPPPDHTGQFESIWQGVRAEHKSRQATEDEATFGGAGDFFSEEDLKAFENFDSSLGLNTHSNGVNTDLEQTPYMFEAENPFLETPHSTNSAFEQGLQILKENGNLSLASLAFEAAVQESPSHVEAWVLLGSSQAQNEKESPAIRAYEHAIRLDPDNLDALMGLAVSYTNEGYESTAYRTLERWLSVKYPTILPPSTLTPISELGFTARSALHQKVTDAFISAAQISPSGPSMDPDVQVGLGVLFYAADDADKAIDCFSAALASTVEGSANRAGQVHLLWNRLGATLANSGRSEDAIGAYEQALTANPSFVRARYNLGVSCINIGCYPQAVQHLLGALSMHRVADRAGLKKAREIVGDEGKGKGKENSGVGAGVDDETLSRLIQQNESSNLYDTLRRVFNLMKRPGLLEMVGAGMDLDSFRAEFEF